jgi:hypothetical protein
MLFLYDIRKIGNEVICHGSQDGVNATEFDLAVDLTTMEPSKISIEPNFAVNQAYGKIWRLIHKHGADNLPETAAVATH